MVKIRRNRQPRDWQKVTHMRSFSGTIKGVEAFTVKEIPLEAQIHKLSRKLGKKKRVIKRIIEAKGSRKGDELAELEARQVREEKNYNITLTKILSLQRRIDNQTQRIVTQRENEKQKEEIHKKNLEKIVPSKEPEDTKGYLNFVKNPDDKFVGQHKIVKVGNKRLVKEKGRHKVWDNK